MITVYSAPWCAYCRQAKNYLDAIGVKYTDLDVENDPENGRAAVEKSGQVGIPVIDIDGTIILGFDKKMIDITLKDKKLVK